MSYIGSFTNVFGGIDSITGNAGGVILPIGGNLNIVGGNNITTTGNPATATLSIAVTGTTNHAVQVGNATGSLTSLPLALTGQGMMGSTGADPIWTGSPSFSGLVTAATGLTATAGNVTITAGNITLPNTNAAGTEGEITLGGNRWISNYNNNTFVGELSGNTTLTGDGNVSLGKHNGLVLTTGDANTFIGHGSGIRVTTGFSNTGLGANALSASAIAGLTTGEANTAIGNDSLWAVETGSRNTALGNGAGSGLRAADSDNIIINAIGTVGDTNTFRVGRATGAGVYELNRSFISGIRGITPATADASMVIIDSLGQLGTLAAATNGQIPIGSTGANMVLGTIASAGGTVAITNGAGTINLDVSPGLATATGFATWGGAGNYFDDTTLGSFTVSRPGTGYINGKLISWAAPQTIAGLTAGNTYIIYIDAAGIIQKSTAFTESLMQNNILLFECLRDSTPVTNNQITVKENHPYSYQPSVSYWAHEIIGAVIENNNNGANITLNGTVKIQINGDDELSDHGLYTTIPDSAGAAVTFRKMYTDAGGKWATQNATDTFGGFYNSAGTPTALTAGRFAVYTLYCSKDTITSALPFYFAVLNTAQFTSLALANTAISNGTIAQATNELASLEVCQLGYVVFSQGSGTIVQVTISKSTLRQTLSTGGTNTAALVNTVTTNFNNILSSADTNVQAALETIDDWSSWITATANVSPMVADRGYITKHAVPATMVTYTLPTTSTVGRRYRVVGYTAGGFRIAQNANQQILFGASATTIGVGGYIESTDKGDAVELVCVTADLEWRVLSVIGNITIV